MIEQAVVLGVKHGQHPEVVTYAVAEASRRDLPLQVVHVTDHPIASRVLFDAIRAATQARPELAVDYVVRPGEPVEVLLAEAEHASLVVLGADDAPWVARAVGAEIAQVVASHAVAPVVVVPRTRLPGRLSSGVVAALDTDRDIDGQLAFALDAADRLHEELRIVSACTGYPARVAARGRIDDAVERWRSRFPRVAVHTTVESGQPVQMGVVASMGASLLVVGQPAGEHPRLVTRAVASRLLRRSSAPVAVVPLDYARSGNLA